MPKKKSVESTTKVFTNTTYFCSECGRPIYRDSTDAFVLFHMTTPKCSMSGKRFAAPYVELTEVE